MGWGLSFKTLLQLVQNLFAVFSTATTEPMKCIFLMLTTFRSNYREAVLLFLTVGIHD